VDDAQRVQGGYMNNVFALFEMFESDPSVTNAWASLVAVFQRYYSYKWTDMEVHQKVSEVVQWLIEYAPTFEYWRDHPAKWVEMYQIEGLCQCAIWTGYEQEFGIVTNIHHAFTDLKSFRIEFDSFNDLMGSPDDQYEVLQAMQDRHFQRGCIVSDMTDYRS
jgi:hypothetical protein